MITWQIKNVTIPLSQGVWTPDLAAWWLRMREPHPQSHVTHEPSGYVKHQRCYTSTFPRLWIPNLADWWLRMKRHPPQSQVKYRSSGQVTNQKYFIFTFTRFKAHKLSRVITVRMRRCPWLRRQATTTQLVVYNCPTSSWSSLLKTDRFQMIMTALKWFLWWRITYELDAYVE